MTWKNHHKIRLKMTIINLYPVMTNVVNQILCLRSKYFSVLVSHYYILHYNVTYKMVSSEWKRSTFKSESYFFRIFRPRMSFIQIIYSLELAPKNTAMPPTVHKNFPCKILLSKFEISDPKNSLNNDWPSCMTGCISTIRVFQYFWPTYWSRTLLVRSMILPNKIWEISACYISQKV